MNYFSRSERIEIEEGQLVRIITAYGHGKAHNGRCMDVVKQFEDGRKFFRNIERRTVAGWLIEWPGQKYHDYCGGYDMGEHTAKLDPWYKCNIAFDGFCTETPTAADKAKIFKLYPKFKWVFEKSKHLTIEQIFHILPEWKKHPLLVESLLENGYKTMALNKSFYKLKDPKRILDWIIQHPEEKYITLAEIQAMQKWGIDMEELRAYSNDDDRYAHLQYDCWKHFQTVLLPNVKNKKTYSNVFTARREYHDYLAMAKEAGHNIKDSYWRFPKASGIRSLKKLHDKCLAEIEEKKRLQREKEMQVSQAEYSAAIEIFKKNFKAKFKELVDGKLECFIPETIKEMEHQANHLHQCLMSCKYYTKVAEKKEVLVFIRKNGKPYATAEILLHGKKVALGQFNGMQGKAAYRIGSKAKDDAKQIFNKWAKANKLKIAA